MDSYEKGQSQQPPVYTPMMGQPQQPQPGYGQPPQPGYGQQPQVLYMTQQPLSNPPNDYLGFSIFVCVCCFWPVGICAIISSLDSRNATARGDLAVAQQKSRTAKNLAVASLVIGIILTILYIVLVVLYVIGVIFVGTTSTYNG